MPARSRARLRRAVAEHGAQRVRSILRRVAKPARTSSNSARRIGDRDRRRTCRTSCTSALSTFGRGTNTVGGTMPDDRRVARSTRPSPTPRRTASSPTRGRQPLPHLALHHHQHAVDHRRFFERAHDHRRRDVVRQVRHHRPARRRRRAAPASRRSARRRATTSTSRPPTTSSSTGSEVPVELDRAARARRRRRSATVSDPTPGPTSTTRSPGSHARRAARCGAAVFGSARKFWPSALLGRTPCCVEQRADLASASPLDAEHRAPRSRA